MKNEVKGLISNKDSSIVFENGKLDQGTYTLHIIYDDAIIEKQKIEVKKQFRKLP